MAGAPVLRMGWSRKRRAEENCKLPGLVVKINIGNLGLGGTRQHEAQFILFIGLETFGKMEEDYGGKRLQNH
jgi:hypothetical protein